MIRTARESDVDDLLAMGRAMYSESPRYSDLPFSETKARALIANLLPTGGIFVAEINGMVVGMLAGYCVEHFFGPGKYAGDLVVYVLPDFRGSSCAVRLVRALEQWAEEQGAKEILLGVSTEVETERTTTLYKHLGYRASGCSLIKHV